MKSIKYISLGILFGVIMVKSEAASWYRIQEMFRFQSFHMYGLMLTAVALGAVGILIMKKIRLKDADGAPIHFPQKKKGWKNYLTGGIIFGLGWALTGACPGPVFVNIGYGYAGMVLVALGALAGTFLYGVIKDKLPH